MPGLTVRADRADGRWSVRVALEADATKDTIRSVRVIVFDRDAGTTMLHTVWSDWLAIPLLVARIPRAPLSALAMETAAADIAEALLTLLGHDAAPCLAALNAGDVPRFAAALDRRSRQYRHIAREVAWHDPPANGGAGHGIATSEAGVAQRTPAGWTSDRADRARGDR